jgi:RNA polymerase sigma factor (sigma-70 family)
VKSAPEAPAGDRSNTGHSHEPSRTISRQARILAGLTVTLLAFTPAHRTLVHPKGPTPMCDNPPVTDLVTRATAGDKQAWDALVERYAPLVWSICTRYRLGAADAQDVGRSVWLHLVEQLGNLRDPAALPRWLATTTRLECARALRAAHGPQAAVLALDAENICEGPAEIAEQQLLAAEQQLLAAERHVALRQAFTSLPPRCQQLITLLIHDPPMPYGQISATLGVPVGSIGSLRGRCLHQLRSAPAIATLMNTGAAATPGQQ